MGKLGTALAVASAATFLTSCTTLDEGVVVAKHYRAAEEEFERLGPAYIVEIKGQTGEGRVENVKRLVSREEWNRIQVGDRYSAGRRPKKDREAKREREEAASQAKARPEEKATPTPRPTPAKRKKEDRAVSRDRAEATPTPTPAATAGTPTPSPSPSPSPAASPAMAAKPSPSPAARATASPSPKAKPPARLSAAEEERRYRSARAKAIEDPSVRALKLKIHAAVTNEEQTKAADAYQQAIRVRIIEIDPALKSRVEREGAGAGR